jgi:hypothetical protein
VVFEVGADHFDRRSIMGSHQCADIVRLAVGCMLHDLLHVVLHLFDHTSCQQEIGTSLLKFEFGLDLLVGVRRLSLGYSHYILLHRQLVPTSRGNTDNFHHDGANAIEVIVAFLFELLLCIMPFVCGDQAFHGIFRGISARFALDDVWSNLHLWESNIQHVGCFHRDRSYDAVALKVVRVWIMRAEMLALESMAVDQPIRQ